MIYLNHAGTSWPKPAPVQAAAAAALAAPVDGWAGSFETHHQAVARAFGIEDPGRLLLTPGCTSALAVAVADHDWQTGDRVVISGFEHHALHRPVSKLAAQGVDVVTVRGSADEPVALDELEAVLRAGPVRLVAMTAAGNVTGTLLPVAEIARLAHEHGALFLLDAAQVAGWLPIDVTAWDVDLLAFAGHKGLQAPWGIGGLYVAPHVAMNSPAAVCELPAPGAMQATTAEGNPSPAACATMPGYCDVGSVDRAALAGLAAGLAWLDEPGQADRLTRCRELIARLAAAVSAFPHVTLHGPRDPEARCPTLAFTTSTHSPAELAQALAERGVLVGSGLQCAPSAHETLGTAPHGVLRLSVGPAQGDDDIGTAIAALREVLRTSS